MEKDVFIGLEVHVQLLTQSKMFCACNTQFTEKPNIHVCPICLGYPGTLPMPNMQAVNFAYRIASAFNCNLAPVLCFDRKNYFYPDLAKNYQISQFYHPIGTKGCFDFFCDEQEIHIGIIQIHLEEDAGKLIHTSDGSLCDYNRGGMPLVEIVTKPDIKTPLQAEQLFRHIKSLVRYLGVSDGNLAQGSLRCDANISLNYKGKGLGKKVEIKNMNSFKFVRLALEHEVQRQGKLLDTHTVITQETRLWNENKGITVSMRSKETVDDYRYMPDPDMLPIVHKKIFFDTLEKDKIELPFGRSKRFMKEYGLDFKTAMFFTIEKTRADFFEKTLVLLDTNGKTNNKKTLSRIVVDWCMSDVQKFLNKLHLEFGDKPLTAERFAQLLCMLENKTIHGKLAKQILEKVFVEDKDPQIIVEENNLTTTSSEKLISVIKQTLLENTDVSVQYKTNPQKILGFFMGKIMQYTEGKANPIQLKEELKKCLDK